MAGNTVTTKRLSLKPENLESNIFLNYNLRALSISSKDDLKDTPAHFSAPNSGDELPCTASISGDQQNADDDVNIEIVISSDEDDEGNQLD